MPPRIWCVIFSYAWKIHVVKVRGRTNLEALLRFRIDSYTHRWRQYEHKNVRSYFTSLFILSRRPILQPLGNKVDLLFMNLAYLWRLIMDISKTPFVIVVYAVCACR